MQKYVVAAPEQIAVPVVGQDAGFPVRRIYCVGRNYAAHVREMGGDERDPPFFFQKPRDAIVHNNSTLPYPTLTSDFQFEVELVLAIGTGGSNIPKESAAGHVYGLAVGIDFTRRDLQLGARKSGRPWEIGKAFDHSAPITEITPLGSMELPNGGSISLAVNGETKQSADLSELIWDCADVVSLLSTHYRLVAGDLVYTGTPAGVGPVVPGDVLVAKVDGLPDLRVTIGELNSSTEA